MLAVSCQQQLRFNFCGLRDMPSGYVQLNDESKPCYRGLSDGLLAMSHDGQLARRNIQSRHDGICTYRDASDHALRAVSRQQ